MINNGYNRRKDKLKIYLSCQLIHVLMRVHSRRAKDFKKHTGINEIWNDTSKLHRNVAILSKIPEMVLNGRLTKFLRKSNVFSDDKYVLGHRKLTIAAAINLLKGIRTAFNESEDLVLSYYDGSKAFDVCRLQYVIRKIIIIRYSRIMRQITSWHHKKRQ